MRLLLRIMRLALGFWSPSLIMAIEGRRVLEAKRGIADLDILADLARTFDNAG